MQSINLTEKSLISGFPTPSSKSYKNGLCITQSITSKSEYFGPKDDESVIFMSWACHKAQSNIPHTNLTLIKIS